MAVIRKQKGRSSQNFLLSYYKCILCAAFLILAAIATNMLRGGEESFVSALAAKGDFTHLDIARQLNSFEDDKANADKVKSWRKHVEADCQSASTKEDMTRVKNLIKQEGFVAPSLRKEVDYSSPQTTRWCKNVVIDFGSNVGDSVGKIIDGGLPGCNKRNLDPEANKQKSMAEPIFLQGEERIDAGRWNGLSKYFRERIVEMDKKAKGENQQPLGPEDYCMYGVEGNPAFTSRLQKLEQYILSLQPRPLRHLHIFTETVGAAKDGQTEIFLDTVNEDKNFWGSSIIASHRDVKAGAVAQSGGKTASKMVATPVEGVTLTSLMTKTLAAFAPSGGDEKGGDKDRSGGHLFVKIDIEGGEYQLLNEAFDSNIMCEYVKMGNSLDIIVEFHTENLIGKNADLHRYYKEVKQSLLDCGVNIKRLPSMWA